MHCDFTAPFAPMTSARNPAKAGGWRSIWQADQNHLVQDVDSIASFLCT